MAFTSIWFPVFLLAALAAYYGLPRRMQWVVLLAASYGFYCAGGLKTVGYLLFTTATTYGAGLWLGALNDRIRAVPSAEKNTRGAALKRRKKWVVAAAAAANFGVLFFVKYWDTAASAVSGATGMRLPQLNLLLPLGLSFYIFQSVGYVIDCYRGKYAPERNPAKFALFVSFFPQMVQGPISRFDQLGVQLTKERAFDADNLKYGIQLAMAGYMKKLILADRAAVAANAVFQEPGAYGGAVIALGVLCYCVQLYCDFSGGIDITRGVAQMFGIEMTQNFRRPLFAASLPDYWRRWHISLGTWMRDYVFYPLSLSRPFARLGKLTRRRIGGKLGKMIPTSLATFIIYFIIGIWHGANFRYIVFGLYNGVIITGGLLLAGPFAALRERLRIPADSRGLRLFGMLRTMVIVFVGRYITRAPRLVVALRMLWRTVAQPSLRQLTDGTVLRLGLLRQDFVILVLGVAVLLALEYYQERGGRIRRTLERQSAPLQWLAMAVPLALLLFLGVFRDGYIQSEFIYQQF